MKMHLYFIILLALFGCDALPFSDESQAESDIVIRSGESFGLCAGYCIHELEVDGSKVKFKALPRPGGPQPAERFYEGDIDQEVWGNLLASLDVSTVLQMDDVYGCPDCADGGAEWIEIEDGESTKRVTFEYGNAPEEVQAIADLLRSIRKDLKTQVGTGG